jgi:hypothetical protein
MALPCVVLIFIFEAKHRHFKKQRTRNATIGTRDIPNDRPGYEQKNKEETSLRRRPRVRIEPPLAAARINGDDADAAARGVRCVRRKPRVGGVG